MAAPGPAVGSGAVETCGLDQILEALKLLLSPGGEKTHLDTGLGPELLGSPLFQALPCSLSVRPSGFPGTLLLRGFGHCRGSFQTWGD